MRNGIMLLEGDGGGGGVGWGGGGGRWVGGVGGGGAFRHFQTPLTVPRSNSLSLTVQGAGAV